MRFFTGLIFGLMLAVGVTAIVTVMTQDEWHTGTTRHIIHLDKKFGANPSPKAFKKPIVHLATHDGRAYCTAFVVDANYAVTAAHCINSTGKLPTETLKFLDETGADMGVDVTAAGYDDQTDLGLLTGNFSPF